jgi:hypothetical protein
VRIRIGVCHFINQWVRKIDITVFILVRFADQQKICFVRSGSVQNLFAVLQALAAERSHVIARRGNAYHKLVGVGFHGFLYNVVLFCMISSLYSSKVCTGFTSLS